MLVRANASALARESRNRGFQRLPRRVAGESGQLGFDNMQLKYFLAASAASLSLACGLAAVPAMAQQITTAIEGTDRKSTL